MNSCTNELCCPASRRARNLPCFATMAAPKAEPIEAKSYEQLKAENPGCAVVLCRSGMGHGPAQYRVVRRGGK